jgi:hypothetical protein
MVSNGARQLLLQILPTCQGLFGGFVFQLYFQNWSLSGLWVRASVQNQKANAGSY